MKNSNNTALKPINILLVEDNPSDSRLVDIYLKDSYGDSYNLTLSTTLSQTLELLEKTTFDVIILDLGLPDSSGLDTFTKTHEQSPKTPIIILTGLIEEQLGENAIKQGASDFLSKGTLKNTELKRSINGSIERSKLQQEVARLKKNQQQQEKLEK